MRQRATVAGRADKRARLVAANGSIGATKRTRSAMGAATGSRRSRAVAVTRGWNTNAAGQTAQATRGGGGLQQGTITTPDTQAREMLQLSRVLELMAMRPVRHGSVGTMSVLGSSCGAAQAADRCRHKAPRGGLQDAAAGADPGPRVVGTFEGMCALFSQGVETFVRVSPGSTEMQSGTRFHLWIICGSWEWHLASIPLLARWQSASEHALHRG